MANIHPFRAIRPNSIYADHLVFTTMQAESVAGDLNKSGSMPPLKTLLETAARQRPETPESQAEAFEEINQTLQSLLDKNRLWQEEKPGVYIYEIAYKTYRQTGIWAMTDLADYTNGDIKTHELTFDDSVRRQKNYREHVGLEGNPVLLTYEPNVAINRIIAESREKYKKASVGNREGFHRIWKIEDGRVVKKLVDIFKNIGSVYVADGHHRLKSAGLLADEQRVAGLPVYDRISTLYMASDQLRMEEYNRLIKPEAAIDKDFLMDSVLENFYADRIRGNNPVEPNEQGQIGMYAFGRWFNLTPREKARGTFAERLDVSVLQKQILAPVFGITNPGTDGRLKCIGGSKAIEEIQFLLEDNPDAFAFTLCPMTVEQLLDVADAGEILPPKSTWITPKVPYGILMYNHRAPVI